MPFWAGLYLQALNSVYISHRSESKNGILPVCNFINGWQRRLGPSDLICTSFLLLGRLSFSGWSTEYFLRQQTPGICKFCLFHTTGALLESSQICVGFPSLFFENRTCKKSSVSWKCWKINRPTTALQCERLCMQHTCSPGDL